LEIITADWETYYDKDYSLSKITTEAYIRDPRFEAIMLALRLPDGTKRVITGDRAQISHELAAYDWSKYAILCHNTLFDGAIFAWHFGVNPAAWLDTYSMGRAMFGNKGNSLATLAEKYNLQEKGKYVGNMLGRRRASLTTEEFKEYAKYCLNDVDLCWELFQLMSAGWYDPTTLDLRYPFPIRELELIDAHIRMFTEPKLRLNIDKLRLHLDEVVTKKESLLHTSGMDKMDLMSNNKFAELLISLGVEPPMKVSPTTGKPAYAFAKTDEGMKDLLEHPSIKVQTIVAARLGVKSTIEETRTLRFIGIAERDPIFPVPLRYCAAHTKRSGGTDKINLQNLSSRGAGAGKLKEAIEPPEDYIVGNADSSNIEARMLAWLAEQDDLVTDFANGVDVYCKMASTIYGKVITKNENPLERFVGKTVILGAGYQTGGGKLQITLKTATPPMDMPIEWCDQTIKAYRDRYPKIPKLWKAGERALQAMVDNQGAWIGREGVAWVEGNKGIKLPSGLYLSYPELQKYKAKDGFTKWKYKSDNGWTDIYGGKVIENLVQALARIVVMMQLLKIRKRYPVVLTVHDSVVYLAKKEEAEEATKFVVDCMRWVPKWAIGCPINCEASYGENYGACKG
jgi:DNA polymerase family A